ncbi:DUF5305 family protein [Thermococcus thioreducens]|uniref:DUF5305 domain-containing protein n=1 Tax=Thermococcus thioreducens TaxID=277988 RepID=A0A0Q2M3T1_9EURY|nr:DUF5305 family protein [Thermococcus thioreducens]ASJ11653.1 hypothetical protein A3L14_01555 [Thermococcus thioreducens]KQH82610.1 hypothetical protein AMR53_04880 [Thermococcus thioreducens]SEW16207.1 hypothetical protein SAMN05216170_1970 [Thermococcus thioreducens]
MKKEKFAGFIRRKEVLGVFLILFLVFAFYSVKLMSASPYVVNTQTLGTFKEEGQLKHAAYLKPNEIYGYMVFRDEYPISLVDRFLLTYTYSSNPPLSTGTYEVTGKVVYYVTKGSEEVTMWEGTLFDEKGKLQNGGFTVEYTLDMGELDRMTAEVSNELGMKRLNRRVIITTKVLGTGNVGGKEITRSFDHEVELIRDSGAGLYYFTDTSKSAKKTLTTTTKEEVSASVLGVTSSLDTAKVMTTLLALLMLIPLVGYVYTSRPSKDELAKIRPYIVKGAPGPVQKRVVLKTPKDLETTFELVDKPVLHYIEGEDEVFAIIDDGISYEYRKPLPQGGEEAS